MDDEPIITVNGVQLTSAQARMVRASLQSFGADLVNDGLGEDEAGKEITRNFLDRIKEIHALIYREEGQ